MRAGHILALATLLVATSAFAGCFSGDDSSDVAPAAVANTSAPPEVGTFATGGLGADETNRTVEGAGGRPHIHDYWLNDVEKTLYDGNVRWDIFPITPDDDAAGKGVWSAHFDLPNGTLVFEGTGKIIIMVNATTPADVPIIFEYRTASGSEWNPPVKVTPGAPIEIEVNPLTADSPHAYRSAWSFRFRSDLPGHVLPPMTQIPTKIVAVKARNVEFWPGHPDFYADSPSRVVLEADAVTRYDSTKAITSSNWGTRIPPEKLISMGTTRLEIFVNVTGYNGPPGTSSGTIFMYHRHANMTSDNQFDDNTHDVEATAEGGHFQVTDIGHTMHDAPYATSSRWTFRVMASINTVVDGCGDCTPYELAYHIKVVAWNDDWVDPASIPAEPSGDDPASPRT